jgi:catechol 2,3-dioxygenase-like lactoylglutathione lyase family enzyme
MSRTDLVRCFLPAKDFDLSKRFYEALGFEKVLDADIAIFNAGSGGFLLQSGWNDALDGHLMMQLMVDDLDAWWAHFQSLDLVSKFGLAMKPRPPAMQPWGLRIAYIADPSGVLWHIAERRDGAKQDR